MIKTDPKAIITIKANISTFEATPNPATASSPNVDNILVMIPSDIGVMSRVREAGAAIYNIFFQVESISFILPKLIVISFSRLIRIVIIAMKPMLRAITVARAAPLIPISGNGPRPKISRGSMIIFAV